MSLRTAQVLTCFTIAFVLALLLLTAAMAHEAPAGWEYDLKCCSNRDCARVEPSAVSEDARGVTVTLKAGAHPMLDGDFTGFVPWGDPRLKDSPDGEFHACIGPELRDGPRTTARGLLCVYLPPRGM